MGLWSGQITLKDLEVNTAAVKKLGLPIAVLGGRVESLELSIPWNRLGSSPVKIRIEGVYVLVTLDEAPGSLKPDALAEKVCTLVRAQLARADAAFSKRLDAADGDAPAAEADAPAKKGMAARYAAKIVDNLEVSVRRVHARYEDDRSAVGTTLGSFEARAVNDKWEAAFVERNDDRLGSDRLLRNVVQLDRLALYWQHGTRMAGTANFRDVASRLGALVATKGSGAVAALEHAYVLRPLDASLRLTRNDRDLPGLPRYRLDFNTTKNARLDVRASMLRGASTTAKRVVLLQRQQALVKRHPALSLGDKARPVTRANAGLWWRYAAELVCPALAATRRGRSAFATDTLRTLRSRERYVALYAASLGTEPTTDLDDAEMRRIELSVPVEALAMWRQTVLLRHRDLAKKKTAAKKQGEAKSDAARKQPGFWGRLMGRGTHAVEPDPVDDRASDEDDDTLDDLESIARHIEEEEARAKPPEGFELVRAVVRTGCRIALYDGDDVLSEFGVDLSAFARHTADGKELDLVAGLGELYLRDATGLASRSGTLDDSHNLICHEVADDADADYPFEAALAAIRSKLPKLALDGDANSAVDAGEAPVQLLLSRRSLDLGKEQTSRLDLVARARPFRFAYHAPTIARVVEVFKPPPEDRRALAKGAMEARAAAGVYARRAAADALEKLNEPEGGEEKAHSDAQPDTQLVYSLAIDAKLGAPTILLPRNWHHADGAFEVDTGAIIINGGIDAREARRQSWSVEIREAKIARLNTSMKPAGNIIAPFGVSLKLQLSGPRSPAPPVVLDFVSSPLSISLAPSSLRELLELAALLSLGLQTDAQLDHEPDPPVIEELDPLALAGPSSDDNQATPADPPLAQRDDSPPLPSTARQRTTFKLTARLPLIELKLSSTASLAYVAKIATLEVDLALRSLGSMVMHTTLKSIALDDHQAGFSIVESFSAADCIETAQAAAQARMQLPIAQEIGEDGELSADEDALLSISMMTQPNQPFGENAFATRIVLSFSTLRAKCGAATLLPLQPLMAELIEGLAAFSAASRSPHDHDQQRHQDLDVQTEFEASRPNGRLLVVATIGEISAVVLDESGMSAIASASLRGTALLWSAHASGQRSAAVRVAELAIDDARAKASQSAFSRVVVPKHHRGSCDVPKHHRASSNEMLARIDFSDDAVHRNVTGLIRPVSIYVLPEPLYLTLSAIRSLIASLGTVFSRTNPEKVNEHPAMDIGSPEPPRVVAHQPRLLTVNVQLPDAEVVLVRDAAKADSEALIMRLGAHAEMKMNTHDNGEGELALQASLEDLSMMLAEDGTHDSTNSLLHLLDPVTARISFKRRTDNEGDPFDTSVSADLTELAARVSYRDVLAIIAMIGALRPTISKDGDPTIDQSSSAASSTSRNETIPAPPVKTKISVLKASAAFAGARLIFVDDSLGTSVPMLNVTIGTLNAGIDGPTTALVGSASCTFSATTFNHECLTYEPLLRRFAVDISMNFSGSAKRTIVVATNEVVEVVYSSTFVTELAQVGGRLKREASLAFRNTSQKIKGVRDAPPLLVANETEIMLRCRVSGEDGPWLEIQPGSRVAVGLPSAKDKLIGSSGLLRSPDAVDICNIPKQVNTPDFCLRRLVTSAPQRSVHRNLGTVPALANGVSWHVAFNYETGRFLAQFKSRVSVANRTPIAIELAADDTETPIVVEAKNSRTVPLSFARRGVALRLRRRDQKERWTWSKSNTLRVWEQDGTEAEEGPRSTRGGLHKSRSSSDFISTFKGPGTTSSQGVGESRKQLVATSGHAVQTQFVVFGVHRVPSASLNSSAADDEARIMLAPPLVVRSKLPCGVVLTLANSDAETRLRVGPGEEVGCCDLDVSKSGMWLACRVADFRGKCDTKLTPRNAAKKAPPGTGLDYSTDFSGSTSGLYELILHRGGAVRQLKGRQPVNNGNDALQLELRVEHRHRKLGLHLTLSCPLWIVDRTELGLGFAYSPPQVFDKITSSFFGSDARGKSRGSLVVAKEDDADVETRQRVPSSLLGNAVSIWVASQRPHTLAQPACQGDPAYAEGQQAPFLFSSAPPGPLAAAIRFVTYDAERAGPSNQPAIFNKLTQQHQQRMRRVGLESEASKARRALQYITFRNNDPERMLDVYVAVDARVERTPEWLLDGGAFARAADVGSVELRRKRGPLSFKQEDDVRPYVVWWTEVAPESKVDLGPNEDQAMYLVFLAFREKRALALDAPDTSETAIAAILSNDATSHNDAAAGDWLQSWPGREWLGQVGAKLLCSPEGRKFAINRCAKKSSWSSRLDVGGPASFPVSMEDGNIGTLELDVRCTPLRGSFADYGSLVEIGPRYALWNIDPDFVLYARQKGQPVSARYQLEVGQDIAVPWHWPDNRLPTELQFGACVGGAVAWSLGAIPIESVGGHALLTTCQDVVIRVEVSLNTDVKLPPYESVVVYVSVERPETALFAARNLLSTGADASFWQGQQLLANVPAGQMRIIGWANAANTHNIEVEVNGKKRTMVDVDAVRVETELSYGQLTAAVYVEEGTRIIGVGPRGQLGSDSSDAEVEERMISLQLAGIGLSVVAYDADKVRRELTYARLTSLEVSLHSNGLTDEFQMSISSFQLDNHAPNALWPTYVAPSARDEDDAEKALVSVTAVKARHGDGSTSLRYFAARILPLDIHADFSSLNTLGRGLAAGPRDVLNAEEALAEASPAEWAYSLSRSKRHNTADDVVQDRLTEARRRALRPRGYVEMLLLHPMEATISFEPTPAEEHDVRLSLLSHVQTLATISNASIRLNSFIVRNDCQFCAHMFWLRRSSAPLSRRHLSSLVFYGITSFRSCPSCLG